MNVFEAIDKIYFKIDSWFTRKKWKSEQKWKLENKALNK